MSYDMNMNFISAIFYINHPKKIDMSPFFHSNPTSQMYALQLYLKRIGSDGLKLLDKAIKTIV